MKRYLVPIVILIIVWGILLFQEEYRWNSVAGIQQQLVLEGESVESLRIATAENGVSLERKGLDSSSEWVFSDNTAESVDQAKVKEFLQGIAQIRLGDPLPANELGDDLSVFDLDPPLVEVRLRTTDREITIKQGKQNNYLGKTYFQIFPEEAVYLLPGTGISEPLVDREYFRNRYLFQAADSQIQKITLLKDPEQLILEQKEIGKWDMGTDIPVDIKAVEELTRLFRSFEAKQFFQSLDEVDVAADLQKMLGVDFELSGGEENSFTLFLFSENEEHRVFVLNNKDLSVQEVEKNPLVFLRPDQDRFRIRRFFPFAIDQIFQADFLLYPDRQITIQRVKDRWVVNGKQGDSIFVEQLLRNLSQLEASGFPDHETDFGFGNPRMKTLIKISSLDSENPFRDYVLLIGDFSGSTVSGEEQYYAIIENESPPFLITKKAYRRIFPREEVLVQHTEVLPLELEK